MTHSYMIHDSLVRAQEDLDKDAVSDALYAAFEASFLHPALSRPPVRCASFLGRIIGLFYRDVGLFCRCRALLQRCRDLRGVRGILPPPRSLLSGVPPFLAETQGSFTEM